MKHSKALHLPPGLRLNGDLRVRGDARIACALRGTLRVEGRLEIDPQAVIDGEVASGSLQLEPGATVRAHLRVGEGTEAAPAKLTAPLRRFLPGFLAAK